MAIRKENEQMSIIKNNESYYEANYRAFQVFENLTSNNEIINAFEQDQDKSAAMLRSIIEEGMKFTVKEFVRLMDALRMEVPPRLREAVAESEAAPYCGPCCGGEDEFEVNEEATDF